MPRPVRLQVLPAAAHSIVEQADYYELKQNEVLALRWQLAVDKAIQSLLRSPRKGSPCRFPSPLLADLRRIPIPRFPKHYVFYRFTEEQNTLIVINVIHGARDLESLLSTPLQ